MYFQWARVAYNITLVRTSFHTSLPVGNIYIYMGHLCQIVKFLVFSVLTGFNKGSKAVLLLWIFYVFVLSCVCYVCARLFICALWSPAGKGLTSWLSFVVSSVSVSLSHWYPGSGVVLDCIDS